MLRHAGKQVLVIPMIWPAVLSTELPLLVCRLLTSAAHTCIIQRSSRPVQF